MVRKRKAVRNIFGKIIHYTPTKTVGLKEQISGKIMKRITNKDAKKRDPQLKRVYTPSDDTKGYYTFGIKKKKMKLGKIF